MTLGAEGVVSDSAGRILLLRDTSHVWRLPGATVAAGQTAEAALRGILEVQGIAAEHADPALFWMFTDAAPWDMVATFRLMLPHAALDSASAHASQVFFMPDALPTGIEAATMFRIKQVIQGQPPFDL